MCARRSLSCLRSNSSVLRLPSDVWFIWPRADTHKSWTVHGRKPVEPYRFANFANGEGEGGDVTFPGWNNAHHILALDSCRTGENGREACDNCPH